MKKTLRIVSGVCNSVNPAGCFSNVRNWIEAEKKLPPIEDGPRSVLILGCSGGYGMGARISAAFGAGARTLGVSFERQPTVRKKGTPGWYNNHAFDMASAEAGLFSETLLGDAFSNVTREAVIERVKKNGMGAFDLVIYSLASPMRTDPVSGVTYRSIIKPTGKKLTGSTLDVATGKMTDVSFDPATEDEIASTVKVMGGEDWKLWIEALQGADMLAHDAKTIALSYIGPDATHAIYRSGTLGKAKEHLEATAAEINELISKKRGSAYVSVNRALVTRASVVIPIMSAYLCALNKVLKAKGLNENCHEQMSRLLRDRLYGSDPVVAVDEKGRIRLDDWEMREDVQVETASILERLTPDNVEKLTDWAGCSDELFGLFGFSPADRA
ncbi:MAG: trans-2-enoyl-CoA reductase family protein [Kiritimatiellae bacterium]|jgi:enoyl-[acyl-carrier protein] reductase/trans-2-enoyl-CoA reductase (NAD+)|nr:trans-2-enoyl-CoA reductase family protein [Kiritimatiellia bacterium]